MGAILVPVVAVVILLGIGAVLLKRMGTRTVSEQQEARADSSRLDYRVPNGQDPAAVLVALTRAGFEATPAAGDSRSLSIGLPLGAEQREERAAVPGLRAVSLRPSGARKRA